MLRSRRGKILLGIKHHGRANDHAHRGKWNLLFVRMTLLIVSSWCVKTIKRSYKHELETLFIYLIKPANLLPVLLRRTNAVSGILVLKRLPVNPCRPNSNHNEPTWVNRCFLSMAQCSLESKTPLQTFTLLPRTPTEVNTSVSTLLLRLLLNILVLR